MIQVRPNAQFHRSFVTLGAFKLKLGHIDFLLIITLIWDQCTAYHRVEFHSRRRLFWQFFFEFDPAGGKKDAILAKQQASRISSLRACPKNEARWHDTVGKKSNHFHHESLDARGDFDFHRLHYSLGQNEDKQQDHDDNDMCKSCPSSVQIFLGSLWMQKKKYPNKASSAYALCIVFWSLLFDPLIREPQGL